MQPATLFRALGDPIRLEMLNRLSLGNARTISELSDNLDISRQGARKHLQLLAEAELVNFSIRGRETHVALNRKTLEQGKFFIAQMEQAWDARLEALKQFVES